MRIGIPPINIYGSKLNLEIETRAEAARTRCSSVPVDEKARPGSPPTAPHDLLAGGLGFGGGDPGWVISQLGSMRPRGRGFGPWRLKRLPPARSRRFSRCLPRHPTPKMHAMPTSNTVEPTIKPDRAGLARDLREHLQDAIHEIDNLEPAPRAIACGAVGCTVDEDLFHIRIDEVGKRVLCPTHLTRWVEQEVFDDV